MKFDCAICIFLNSENLICRNDGYLEMFQRVPSTSSNESRLYLKYSHIFIEKKKKKKTETLQKLLSFFHKNICVFGNKVVKHLTS